METVLAALRLLTRLFVALKALIELNGSGGDGVHPKARRPKHLKE